MPPASPSTASLSKGHLIAVGLALLFLALSPGGREYIWKQIPMPQWFPAVGTREGKAEITSTASNLKHYREDLAAFNQWITSDETPAASIRIQRQDNVAAAPIIRPGKEPVMWVPIAGTVSADDGTWKALWNGKEWSPGDLIMPEPVRVGYRLLSVSRKCIWFAAYRDETQPPAENWVGAWPDIESIPVPLDLGATPDRVELRKEEYFRPQDALELPTGSRYVVQKIWPNAVHLQHLVPGGQATDLLCVVLPVPG